MRKREPTKARSASPARTRYVTGLNATAVGTPVGSVQRKLSAGTFHFVIRPIGGSPKERQRAARCGWYGVQIAARPPLDSLSDTLTSSRSSWAISSGPHDTATEVAQARSGTRQEAQRRARSASPCLLSPAGMRRSSRWRRPYNATMLLVDLPDDLLVQILASRTKKLARGLHSGYSTRARVTL